MVFEGIEREYQNLARVLNEMHHLEEEYTKSIILKVLIGINHLHSYGIVHGDISAENIYVNKNLDIKVSNVGLGFIASSIYNHRVGN